MYIIASDGRLIGRHIFKTPLACGAPAGFSLRHEGRAISLDTTARALSRLCDYAPGVRFSVWRFLWDSAFVLWDKRRTLDE
jgi:hypothetical protein